MSGTRYDGAEKSLAAGSIFVIHPPGDRRSFGYLLWQIMGETETDIVAAMECLQIDRPGFYGHIYGIRGISYELIIKNRWAQRLDEYFPKNWLLFKEKFYEHVERIRQQTLNSITANRGAAGYAAQLIAVASEPENQTSFGFLLWQIMGKSKINIEKALACLKIDSRAFVGFIYGHRQVQYALIIRNQWDQRLAKSYPEDWVLFKDAFYKHVEKIRQQTQVPPPENKESLGYAVWQILGGEKFDLDLASERLGIRKSVLTSVLENRFKTQKKIKAELDFGKLETCYPQTWKKYKSKFQRHFGSFKETESEVWLRIPDNKKTFGFVLSKIIGGRNAHVGKTAEYLGISTPYLSNIIHGRNLVPPKSIIDQWHIKLELKFPDEWQKNKRQYAERLKGAVGAKKVLAKKIAAEILRPKRGQHAVALKSANPQ